MVSVTMYTDARTLPDQTKLETDLAIIGGGPTGITLARAFAGTRVQVCLLEAGGQTGDADVQALYSGENIGIDYSLTASRLRFFGGSSNHWGGFTRPLDPIDFQQREWVPHSGWPFGIEALAPYYTEACALVEVLPDHFDDIAYWQQASGETFPAFTTGRMRPQFVQYSPPTRFGRRYGPELQQADNIDVLFHANVTDITTNISPHAVSGLEIRTLNGLTHHVKAKVSVLTTGGLENPRLLLLSNKSIPAGLGNQNDLVGRYFMEHPHLGGCGEIVVAELGKLPRIFRERVRVNGASTNVAFNPTETFLRRNKLLNATFMVGVAGRYQAATQPESLSADARRRVAMLLAARPLITEGENPIETKDSDLIGAWLGIGCACEQSPNPDSRVGLAEERDRFGLRKIQLDWRLSEQDWASLVQHDHSLALEFGAMGIGRMLVNFIASAGWSNKVRGGNHHMGTTRMHDDPKQGVVDRDCRVHETDNLYVAGSSVFPTCGAANPTLTLLALTLRLADHLRKLLT
jgi:choline dehydrogenase-like flavoprotein